MRKAVLPWLFAAMAQAQTVQLTVNTAKVVHAIDQKIYGQSLEHTANGGFRAELRKAVADLHPAVIRWSGAARWKQDIGRVDEFLVFARNAGAAPVILIWPGPRDKIDRTQYLQDAADFVEYCNAPRDSTWGKVRAQRGHPEPYRVRYWELDNEISSMPAV